MIKHIPVKAISQTIKKHGTFKPIDVEIYQMYAFCLDLNAKF